MSNSQPYVDGRGQPIVLLHGWAMHSGIWREFAQQLAQQHQVTCLDLPGHGASDTVTPYTLEAISAALMEQIPHPSFTLVGWSLGATIGLTMAKHYPHRVAALVCLAGNPKFVKTDDWPGIRGELLAEFAHNLNRNCQSTLLKFLALQVHKVAAKKRLLAKLKRDIYACPPPSVKVLTAALEILKHADLRADLSQLRCPLLIIQGDKDTLVPVQVGNAMQSLYPSSQLRIIANAGHAPFLSHPVLLVDTIGSWL